MYYLSNGKLVSLTGKELPSEDTYPELVQFWENNNADILAIVAVDVDGYVWIIKSDGCTKVQDLCNIQYAQIYDEWSEYKIVAKSYDGYVTKAYVNDQGELNGKVVFDNLGPIEQMTDQYFICSDGWVYVNLDDRTNECCRFQQDVSIIELSELMLADDFKVYAGEEITDDFGNMEFRLALVFDQEPVCLIGKDLILTDSGNVYSACTQFITNIPNSEAVMQMEMHLNRLYILYGNSTLVIYELNESWDIIQSIPNVDCLSGCIIRPKFGSKK